MEHKEENYMKYKSVYLLLNKNYEHILSILDLNTTSKGILVWSEMTESSFWGYSKFFFLGRGSWLSLRRPLC